MGQQTDVEDEHVDAGMEREPGDHIGRDHQGLSTGDGNDSGG